MEFITLDLAATLDFINLGVTIPDRPARVEIRKSSLNTRLYYYDLAGEKKYMCSCEIPHVYAHRVYHILKAFECRCGSAHNSIDYETYSFVFLARMLR